MNYVAIIALIVSVAILLFGNNLLFRIHTYFAKKGFHFRKIFGNKLGIINIFPNRFQSFILDYYGNWENILDYKKNNSDESSSKIDIIGINLDGIFKLQKINDNFDVHSITLENFPRIKKLVERVNSGTKINIVLPKADSNYLKLRAESESKDSSLSRWKERIEKNIEILKLIHNEFIYKDKKDNFRLYQTDNIQYYFIFRSDDLMMVTNYLYGYEGDNCPAVLLREESGNISIGKAKFDNWFELYRKDFLAYCVEKNRVKLN